MLYSYYNYILLIIPLHSFFVLFFILFFVLLLYSSLLYSSLLYPSFGVSRFIRVRLRSFIYLQAYLFVYGFARLSISCRLFSVCSFAHVLISFVNLLLPILINLYISKPVYQYTCTLIRPPVLRPVCGRLLPRRFWNRIPGSAFHGSVLPPGARFWE